MSYLFSFIWFFFLFHLFSFVLLHVCIYGKLFVAYIHTVWGICPIDEGGTFALVCSRAFIKWEPGTLPGTPGQQAA